MNKTFFGAKIFLLVFFNFPDDLCRETTGQDPADSPKSLEHPCPALKLNRIFTGHLIGVYTVHGG